MKSKSQIIFVVLGIFLSGFVVPFIPNFIYGSFGDMNGEKILNLSIATIHNKLIDGVPFYVLSVFAFAIFYFAKLGSYNLKKLMGIGATFVWLFIGTIDTNRPLGISHYDVGPGLGFVDLIFVPPLYALGYFLGWLWEMLFGVKDKSENASH